MTDFMTAAMFSLSRRSKLIVSPSAAALLLVLLVVVTPASGGQGIGVSFKLPLAGATVTGNVPWLVEVSERNAKTVDFYIDGTL